MRRKLPFAVYCLAAATAAALPAFGQPAPAGAAGPAAKQGGLDVGAPDTTGIRVDALPAVAQAVKDAQPWQKTEDRVAAQIKDPDLRLQARQGLDALAPRITRALMDRKGEVALVTLAVYWEPGVAGKPGKQAAVALAFEGFGGELNGTFLPRVLSDMPRPPDDPRGAVRPGLSLDTDASVYLCFTLGDDGLAAGLIPHAQMKRQIAEAVRARQAGPGGAAPAPGAPAPQAQVPQPQDVPPLPAPPALPDAPADLPPPPAPGYAGWGPAWGSSWLLPPPTYAYPGDAAPYGYNDLYDWGWQNPVIIVPGRHWHGGWQRDWSHERDEHRNRAHHGTASNPGMSPPPGWRSNGRRAVGQPLDGDVGRQSRDGQSHVGSSGDWQSGIGVEDACRHRPRGRIAARS